MEWYSILTSVLTVLAVPTLFGLVWKDIHDRRKENNSANKRRKEQENLNNMRKVIKEENEPLREDIQKISSSMDDLRNSDITLLRDRMKCSLNFCKNQGYKTTTDMANWNEMYGSYKALGGNHFKEYVNAWKEEMESLPLENEYKKTNGLNGNKKKRKATNKKKEAV